MEALKQHRRSVLPAFTVPHVEVAHVEVEFLDPEAEGFRQPKPAAVQQVCDESIRAGREP